MNPCPSCQHPNRPNAQFCATCGVPLLLQNKYQIVRLLGQGGFGTVYEAQHAELGVQFAIKEFIPPSGMTPPQRQAASAQFLLEARLLANLDHPMLPKVIDFFNQQGRDYLVMEFVPGDTLEETLTKNNAPLAERDVLVWMDELCNALTFLHSHHPPIIHRDIKPSNIKITPGGKIKLLDFGIAKLLTVGAGTGTAARAVTPPYAPLEQYGKGTDTRSDIYALGVTMYQLLTNRLPPEAPDRANQRVIPPRQWNPALTGKTEALVLKAMAEKQAGRFASAEELQQAIRRAQIAPAPTRAAYATAIYAKFQANARRVPIRPLWIVPAVLCGVLFFCSALLVLNQLFPRTNANAGADATATQVARLLIQTATTARGSTTATIQKSATPNNATAKPTRTIASKTVIPLPIPIAATQAPTEISTALPTEIPTALPTEIPTTIPTEIPTLTPTSRPQPNSYSWVKLSPLNAPSERGNYGIAYDSQRHLTVLFGGGRVTSGIGETFEWDGASWTRREFFSERLWRSSPIMVYDPVRQVIVLFGGLNGEGQPLNDTWEYDGQSWKLIGPAHSPPARREACATFDERQGQVLMFGGESQGSLYNDTWIYDGTDWIQQFPANAPSQRRVCAMTYDSARGVAVLFGGWSGQASFNDTWEWDGASWSRRAPQVIPPARGAHALVYHVRLGLTLLFGGDAGACGMLYQDTWAWDGTNWQELDVNPMGTHSVIASAYDSQRDTALLFGGWTGGNGACDISRETWEYTRVR